MTQLLAVVVVFALQHPAMPAGMSHDEHLAQMAKEAALKQRGTLAMGFDQDKTVHHFPVTAAGGSIEVDVKDLADTASLDLVRQHLKEIARAFATGDFAKPFQTHAEVPPGVPTLQRLNGVIRYRYQETERGAAVRITTSDPDAVKAVHAFLAYQGREHNEGHRK